MLSSHVVTHVLLAPTEKAVFGEFVARAADWGVVGLTPCISSAATDSLGQQQVDLSGTATKVYVAPAASPGHKQQLNPAASHVGQGCQRKLPEHRVTHHRSHIATTPWYTCGSSHVWQPSHSNSNTFLALSWATNAAQDCGVPIWSGLHRIWTRLDWTTPIGSSAHNSLEMQHQVDAGVTCAEVSSARCFSTWRASWVDFWRASAWSWY
jgi:hypothetical protein